LRDDKAIPDGLDVGGGIGRAFPRVKPDLRQKTRRPTREKHTKVLPKSLSRHV
jgi:hypothetical protein